MFFSCRYGSGSLYVPFGQTLQTSLLYKEVPEFLRQLWRQQQARSPEHFYLGFGRTTWNLPAAGEVSS
jgi:hypothetical protein